MLVVCNYLHVFVTNLYIGYCHLESSQAEPEGADAEEQLMGTVPEWQHPRNCVCVCVLMCQIWVTERYIFMKLTTLTLIVQFS